MKNDIFGKFGEKAKVLENSDENNSITLNKRILNVNGGNKNSELVREEVEKIEEVEKFEINCRLASCL